MLPSSFICRTLRNSGDDGIGATLAVHAPRANTGSSRNCWSFMAIPKDVAARWYPGSRVERTIRRRVAEFIGPEIGKSDLTMFALYCKVIVIRKPIAIV